MRVKRALALNLSLLMPFVGSIPAAAEVAGERIVHGDVSIERGVVDEHGVLDPHHTLITASDGAIIEMDRLNVWVGETLQFDQPHAGARVLNRVLGDATRIDGSLLANGLVYILNPAGVFFGGEAIVDVAGLVAAAGDLGNEDFLAGVDRFTDLRGDVVNAGVIRARSVALLGLHVASHGRVETPDGTIALVAGDRIVLARHDGHLVVEVDGPGSDPGVAGVVHEGEIDAGAGQVVFTSGDLYSLAINHEGITRGRDVRVAGGDGGVVRVAGQIDASDARPGERGGEIAITGEKVALQGARLDASGAAAGGRVRVGGDMKGEGTLRTADRTVVDGDTSIAADALVEGDGGSVVVWADEATGFFGALRARGGSQGGDGGFAEISSPRTLVSRGDVDLGAPQGDAGTLLYDPANIVITGGTADGSDLPNASAVELRGDDDTLGVLLFGDVGDGSDPFVIFESEIESTDADIALDASNSITVSGTFGADDVVLMANNSLTMRTSNEAAGASPGIDLTAAGPLTFQTSGDGTITLATGTDPASMGTADIRVGSLTTEGEDVSITTDDGSIVVDTITTDGAVAEIAGRVTLQTIEGSITVDSGISAVGGADGSAGGGRVDLVAGGAGSVDTTAATLDASGGDSADVAGGNGGLVNVSSVDGMVTTGDITSRGGAGGTTADAGGRGGNVNLFTSGTASLDTSAGTIDTQGGAATTGAGGRGGNVDLSTVEGSILAGAITTTGADGGADAGANGGAGGLVEIAAGGTGTADASGAIDTRGGASTTGSGGAGGQVDVTTEDASITVADITTTGGAGGDDGMDMMMEPDGPDGGSGGSILLTSAETDDMVTDADITIDGLLSAFGGAAADPEGDDGPGGVVSLDSADAIEDANPGVVDIATDSGVTLIAEESIASTGMPLQIDGQDATGVGSDADTQLTIDSGGDVGVDVTDAGFNQIGLRMSDPSASAAISQGGSTDVVRIAGASGEDPVVITEVTTTGNAVTVDYMLADEAGMGEENDLVISSDSLALGANLFIRGNRNVTLGDASGAQLATSGHALVVEADDNIDDEGAIAAAPGVTLDLAGGPLFLLARTGVGEAGAPILTQGGGDLTVVTTVSGGIFLSNSGSGDLEITGLELEPLSGPTYEFGGLAVFDGMGDVEVTNDAGAIVLNNTFDFANAAEPVITTQGSVTLTGDVVVVKPDPPPMSVGFNSTQRVVGGGDVTFTGEIDSEAAGMADADLTVTAGGAISLGGNVGDTRSLANLVLDGPVTLAGPTQFRTSEQLAFGGTLDGGGATINGNVAFGGDVGGTTPVSHLHVNTDDTSAPSAPGNIDFTGASRVATAVGAIRLNDNPGNVRVSPAPLATIFSTDGGVHFESAGDFKMGRHEKLAVPGPLWIDAAGDVAVGDLSATDISVSANTGANDLTLLARIVGTTNRPGGFVVTDPGLDIVTNTLSIDAANVVVDGAMGLPAPRIGTRTGVFTGPLPAGVKVVVAKSDLSPVSASDIAFGGTAFDLVASTLTTPSDPQSEIPPPPPAVDSMLPLRPGAEAPVLPELAPQSGEELLRVVRSGSPQPAAPGSLLASERVAEIASVYPRLVGVEAGAPLAQAVRTYQATHPGALDGEALAAWAAAEAVPARRYLEDLATLLVRARMLGLPEAEYTKLREALLEDVLEGLEAPGLTPEALYRAVRASARGLEV